MTQRGHEWPDPAVLTSTTASNSELIRTGSATLDHDDPELAGLLDQEVLYQNEMLAVVAYASVAHPSVLATAATALSNLTVEGYPGHRYHPGAVVFDEVERLAAARARSAFAARYANVQPHSCSSANLAVLFALLESRDTILSLELDSGGHLTHGARASVSGRFFDVVHYGLRTDGYIDHDQVRTLAHRHRPRLVIAGASAYPRAIDYSFFRTVADEVGAYLMADISHIAGLVAAGELPSPVDHAHVTTLSTYKQLGGPRGGLILLGRDEAGPDGRELAPLMQRAVFPAAQGTPNAAAIAAKARALDLVTTGEFRAQARRIRRLAAGLAEGMMRRGHTVLTGGTDNHMVLVDLTPSELTGVVAERALEECGILANKNRIPGDRKPPLITSGLRLGANILAQRGLPVDAADTVAGLIDDVLGATTLLDETSYRIDPRVRRVVRTAVARLCAAHPLPGYVSPERRQR